MLKFPQFGDINLIDRAFFEDILSSFRPEISDFSFTDIFAWRDTFQTAAAELNGNIILQMKAFEKDEHFLLCPIGTNRLEEAFFECTEYLKKTFGYARIYSIPEHIHDTVKNSVGGGRFNPERDYFDYVYSLNELSELKGSKFAGKRNFVKRFNNTYSYTVEEIGNSNTAECALFLQKWCRLKKCSEVSFMKDEVNAVGEMLKHFGELGLNGILIRIEGNVQAFTVASALNSRTLQVHAEKADASFSGIYQALNQMFALRIKDKFELVNREQDLGNPGLRKAKESYHPLRLVKKFSYTL